MTMYKQIGTLIRKQEYLNVNTNQTGNSYISSNVIYLDIFIWTWGSVR
jgi:hypothetical protein